MVVIFAEAYSQVTYMYMYVSGQNWSKLFKCGWNVPLCMRSSRIQGSTTMLKTLSYSFLGPNSTLPPWLQDLSTLADPQVFLSTFSALSQLTSNGIQTRVLGTAPDSNREVFGRRRQARVKRRECTPRHRPTVWTRARDELREPTRFSQSQDLRYM